ncbi:hypothetical protein O0I10_007196 [Lichtheimia ornata]|uniref:Uncharacterized protein n=1 Tax=Lichtheimia ornata TaxID=688661 RepID=A0AAD7V3N9_9FUNG|nr:uncharacterized protein O0I10_007196 [Lichtheimia ornata]KAJ8657116.1 hypothetical protein O0I10_007196 [Lichtheimia ornata]
MNFESVSSHCGAKPFYNTPCLRQTKSLTSKKMENHTMPRRSYSNTSVYMRKKQDDPLFTRNKSRLLRTLTDLFLNRRRRQHEQQPSCWHSQTYTVDLKDDDSSDINSRPIKKLKRQHKPHAENWWAVSSVPASAF